MSSTEAKYPILVLVARGPASPQKLADITRAFGAEMKDTIMGSKEKAAQLLSSDSPSFCPS
jgi:hypothetical protein